MTALTVKQRTKINAVLAYIHDEGFPVARIQRSANASITLGMPAHKAYDKAVEAFLASNRSYVGPLTKIARLIDASDDATVDKYDLALNSYIATGNAAVLEALAPMIQQDAIALAVRHKEVNPVEAANGRVTLDAALGVTGAPKGPASSQAQQMAAASGASGEAPPLPSSFAVGRWLNGTQVGDYQSMPPQAAAKWQATPYTGVVE